MKKILLFNIILLLCIVMIPFSHAEQIFDYVRNPSSVDIINYQGLSNSMIGTNSSPKTGHFFFQTKVLDTGCLTFRNNTVTQFFNLTGKDISCNNVTPRIQVSVFVDNPSYGSIPYAKIGDYNSATNDITVIPYHYNIWESINKPSNNNNLLYDELITAQSKNPSLKRQTNSFGDIGSWIMSSQSFLPYYEWKIDKKNGVCSDEVLYALNAKNLYYSNPSKVNVISDECREYFFESTCSQHPEYNQCAFSTIKTKDTANYLLMDSPDFFNSLYYNENIQYNSYPILIDDIQLKCYKDNILIGWDDLSSGYSFNNDNKNSVNSVSFNYENSRDPYNKQFYAWTNTRYGNMLYSPGNLELNNKIFSLTCPVGTNRYTASIIVGKNDMYRHISPVDATWDFNDVFDIGSGSVFDSTISSSTDYRAILLTQTGVLNQIPPPLNNTYLNGSNPDASRINASNHSSYGTISNDSKISRDDGTLGNSVCVDCKQNISGLSTNGTMGGGSVIKTSVDDSAVSGLLTQAIGENRIESKANFMEKLVQLGILLFTTMIIFSTLFSVLIIIYLFFMLFSIPQKMKQTITDLFKAGLR